MISPDLSRRLAGLIQGESIEVRRRASMITTDVEAMALIRELSDVA